jgi:hypothetical protein
MSAQRENPVYSEPAYTKAVDRALYPFFTPNIDKKLVPEVKAPFLSAMKHFNKSLVDSRPLGEI